MTVEAQDDKGLSVYWDYDAAQIDLNAVSGYEIVRKVRSAVHVFGVIQSFKIYHDSSHQSLSNLRSELWSSGVTLVGWPSNEQKEAATKMMIVDIIAYAWDHPAPRTIVIISGDKDLAYMIGTLRMRKYEVILISVNGTHPSLTSQASVNFDWTVDGRRTDMDDPHGGQLSPHHPSPHPPPSSHSPHQFPSPSFPSLPFPATSGGFSHYSTSNFLSKRQEIYTPMVELQGMPTTRGRHPYDPDKFDIFGASGGSFPSPSVSNGMFGLGDGPSQPRGPARQVRSDSVPPIHSSHSPASPPDSNGLGRTSAKGKQRESPITEPEDIGPQSPLTPEMPEESRTTEGGFRSMHPSAAKTITPLTAGASTRSSSQDSTFSVNQFAPSSTLTSVEPVSDNTTERGKNPAPILVAPQEFTFVPPKNPVVCETEKVSTPTPSLRKEETISTKPSTQATSPIQSQVPDPLRPAPTPLLPSQKVHSPKETTLNIPPSQKAPSSNEALNAQAGPSSTFIAAPNPVPSHKHVPPHFKVLVDTLRQHGGSYPKVVLSTQLVTRDPGVYQKAQVTRCKQYITAAMKAGLVREVNTVQKGLCVFLTEDYA